MRRTVSAFLWLTLIGLLIISLAGCGADIKAENEKLKTEVANIKSDNDKLKLEIQKLKEELTKAAEKDATISAMTAENEALKKQMEDLKGQLSKKKR